MKFEKSADTKVIEQVLSEAKVGESITYESLSKAIGRDVRTYAIGALHSARHAMQRDKNIVFGTEIGVGLVRLNDSQIVESSAEDRRRMHRQAGRAIDKLSCVEFDKLSEAAKKQHIVASAQFGAVKMFSHGNATKKIESKVDAKTVAIPIGDTLKLFGG